MQLLSYADQIIVLGQGGRVTEKGTFRELQTSSEYIGSLHVRQINNDADTGDIEGSRQVLPSDPKPGVALPQATTASANTRGHANKSTILFYLKSLGTLSFLIFLSLVILQMGFRTLQRKLAMLFLNPRTSELTACKL